MPSLTLQKQRGFLASIDSPLSGGSILMGNPTKNLLMIRWHDLAWRNPYRTHNARILQQNSKCGKAAYTHSYTQAVGKTAEHHGEQGILSTPELVAKCVLYPPIGPAQRRPRTGPRHNSSVAAYPQPP
jgi:hypothetical protein